MKYVTMIKFSSYVSANYVLVCLTVDRVVALWKPIFSKQKGKSYMAVLVSGTMALLSAVVTIPILSITDISYNTCCIFNTHLLDQVPSHLYLSLTLWVGVLGIPSGLVFASNALIVYKLRNARSMTQKSHQTTTALVLVSIWFLSLNVVVSYIEKSTAAMKLENVWDEQMNALLKKFMVVVLCFEKKVFLIKPIMKNKKFCAKKC